MKVAFLATIPPGDEPKIQTMFGYAFAARAAMDAEVLIFLALDAGMLAKKKVLNNLEPATRTRIMDALENGVKVSVCSAAVATYGIKREEMVEGIEIAGITSFYQFAAEADITLSW